MREIDAFRRAQKKIELATQVNEFHLQGQHDQKAHGHAGVGELSERQLLNLDKKTTEFKSLMGGRSGASVQLGTGPNGEQIVRKTGITKLSEEKEYLISKLGQALGAPVPNVARRKEGGVVMERAPGSTQGKWGQAPPRRVIPAIRRKEIQESLAAEGAFELGLLDYLGNVSDRRAANFLLDKSGPTPRVFGIDHNSSFWPQRTLLKKYPLSPFADRHIKGNKFNEAGVSNIRKKVKSTKRYFDETGHSDWYDIVQARVNSLETGIYYSVSGHIFSFDEVQTFQSEGQSGKITLYTIGLDGSETPFDYFEVVDGKIAHVSSDFVSNFLSHIESGDQAIDEYSDWSNGWFSTRIEEER